MTEARTDHDRSNRRTLIAVLLLTVPLAVAVFLLLPNGPLFRLFSVPSGSMMPNLSIGSYALVSRASYGYSRHSFDLFELPIERRWPDLGPQRGDVVAFRLPRDHNIYFIKRVIGLPGDRIQMVRGRLALNGETVAREAAPDFVDPEHPQEPIKVYVERLPSGVSYRIRENRGDTGMLDNTALFVVPEGHVFVLGDNRDASTDSREQSPRYGVGFIPIELVLGQVVASYYIGSVDPHLGRVLTSFGGVGR